jgi:hypothetical protein
MRNKITLYLLLSAFTFAETGNQVTISDLKEAVYKLIVNNEKNKSPKVIIKNFPTTKKSYLDKHIRSFVSRNKNLLPKK